MNFLLYVLLVIVIGAILVTVVKKRTTNMILSSIPGVIGVYSLYRYLGLTNSCISTEIIASGCNMELAKMFLFFAYVLLIFSVVCFAFVIIASKTRANQ